MRKLARLIHSPHHLFVFEVCGRLSSFTLAAQELGVSQPAVSLSIKQLEGALGEKLFKREYRSVSFTDVGRQFYAEVALSLDRIWLAANEVKQNEAHNHVTLTTSTAFANYWVVPKLAQLHEQHQEVDFRLQVVDKDIDLTEQSHSLGVRNGNGKWPGYEAVKIAREELVPVASPAYLAKHGRPSTISQLAERHLIHLEEPYRQRATWAQWFAGVNQEAVYSLRDGLKLNDYALVVQAAIAGEGVALGWSHIIEGLVSSGVLEIAIEETWSSSNDTWLIWSNKMALSASAKSVRNWIIESSSM